MDALDTLECKVEDRRTRKPEPSATAISTVPERTSPTSVIHRVLGSRGAPPQVIDDEKRIIRFVGTTSTEDRMGDVVEASGCDYANYVRNPVFQWSHMGNTPAIGKTVALRVEDDGIIFDVQFAKTALANDVYELYKGGFLRATSIGFLPLEIPEKRTPEHYQLSQLAFHFKRWELLELSAVNVPANPNALRNSLYQRFVQSHGVALPADTKGQLAGVLRARGFSLDGGILRPSNDRLQEIANAVGASSAEVIAAADADLEAFIQRGWQAAGRTEGSAAATGTIEGLKKIAALPGIAAATGAMNMDQIGFLKAQVDQLQGDLVLAGFDVEIKGVISHKPYPIQKEDTPWSGPQARKDLAEYARGADGSIDFKKYAQGFAYVEDGKENSVSGYKLPHHNVVKGALKTNFKGCAAAMAAVLGARGGMNLPDAAKKGVYNHLARHYKEFGKVPPAFKDYGEDEMFDILKDCLNPENASGVTQRGADVSDAEPADTNAAQGSSGTGEHPQPTGQEDKSALSEDLVRAHKAMHAVKGFLNSMHERHCGFAMPVGVEDKDDQAQINADSEAETSAGSAMTGEASPPPPQQMSASGATTKVSPAVHEVIVDPNDLDALVQA